MADGGGCLLFLVKIEGVRERSLNFVDDMNNFTYSLP